MPAFAHSVLIVKSEHDDIWLIESSPACRGGQAAHLPACDGQLVEAEDAVVLRVAPTR
jgi:hypothetical protein